MKARTLSISLFLIACGICMPGRLWGQIWKPVAQGVVAAPVASAATNDFLYYAFVDSVTLTKTKIITLARWNGLYWQELPGFKAGAGSYVTSMAWYNNKLYLGGFFDTTLGISSKTGLMALDGLKWINPARRKSDDQSAIRVNDMEVFEGYLWVAGVFSRIDTTRANSLAFYDGNSSYKWSVIKDFQNSVFTGQASCLEIFKDTLYIGGYYNKQGSTKPAPILKIKTKPTIIVTADSTSLFYLVSTLQAGNELMAFGIGDAQKKLIYSYKNQKWTDRSLGFPNLQNATITDAEFYVGDYWAAGIIDIGLSKINTIIKWSDTAEAWLTLEPINLTSVRLLKVFQNKLFAAGNFLNYRRIQLNHVAEFDEKLVIITGRVFNDLNGNCKKDVTENFLPGQVITTLSGLNVAITDKEGIYTFIGGKFGNLTITPVTKKYWTPCPLNHQYPTGPTWENVYDSADFAMQLNGSIEDISINISPNAGDKVRRGFTELYTLSYRNNGGKIIPSYKIQLRIPDSLKNFTAFPAPFSVQNNVATWNFTNLEQGIEKTITFKGKVNTAATGNIGFSAEASGVNDAYSNDNYDTLTQLVEDTLNLNGKFIFPEPEKGDSVTVFDIGGGKYDVEYLIRFENTTADTITTVVLIDTIDLNLSIEYIQELGASHPYTTQVVNLPPQLGKGVLIWTFKNINLPPNNSHSNDFTDNRGHLRFKLRLDGKTPIGTIVKNKADIVFDAANPMTTNYVYCTLDKTTGINELSTVNGATVTVYPNPARTSITLSLSDESTYTYTVTDMQGRNCGPAQTFVGKTANLAVSSLPQGIYFLRISSADGVVYHKKFVKE